MSVASPKRGLMIAAPRSGSGKTTLTLGLLRALCAAAAFASPAPSRDPTISTARFSRRRRNARASISIPGRWRRRWRGAGGALDADLLIAEASMGLFDGAPAAANATGASADIAAWLGLPVVLVLDVSGQAQSAAAIAKGFASYDASIRIAGIVLNKVGSERHRRLAGDAMAALGLPVLGALPRQADIALPERHLGLVQAEETADLEARLDALGRFVAAHVDLDALLALAAPVASTRAAVALRPPGQRIAVERRCPFP